MDTNLRIQICETNSEEELELLLLVMVMVATLKGGVDWKQTVQFRATVNLKSFQYIAFPCILYCFILR